MPGLDDDHVKPLRQALSAGSDPRGLIDAFAGDIRSRLHMPDLTGG
jgi:hypothetical protein